MKEDYCWVSDDMIRKQIIKVRDEMECLGRLLEVRYPGKAREVFGAVGILRQWRRKLKE